MRRLTLALFLLSTVALPVCAYAQETGASSSGTTLEEIVVTARKREESLQSTPLAVTALSSDTLQARNITNVSTLSGSVPTLNIQPDPSTTAGISTSIRGVGGNVDSRPFIEAGVSLYVNGVILPRPSVNMFELLDLQRIEVLRGPQGTLFGRNSTGGAVNFITKKPKDEFHFQQKFSYGTDNDILARSVLDTGKLGGSDLALRLAYLHHQIDGYQKVPGRDESDNPGSKTNDSAYAELNGNLTEKLHINLTADYSYTEAVAAAPQIVVANPAVTKFLSASQSLGGRPFAFYPRSFVETLQPYGDLPPAETEAYGAGLTLDYDINDVFSLKSITGYRKSYNEVHNDQTGSSDGWLGNYFNLGTFAIAPQQVRMFGLFFTDYPGHPFQKAWNDSFSQEAQLNFNTERLKGVFGLYYFHENVKNDNPAGFTLVDASGAFGTFLDEVIRYKIDSSSYAAYGQVSYKPDILDDRLELTAGLRYTRDEKKLNETTDLLRAPYIYRDLEANSDYMSFNTSVSFQWAPDFMTYVRVGNASKAGGFSPGDMSAPYEPEKATVYEAGLRSELFDRRLRANLTVFQTDFDNQQIQEFSNTGGTIVSKTANAGKSEFKGVEAELTAAVMKGLTLDSSVGYLDAKFKEYPYLGQNVAKQAEMQYAPKWTFHAGGQYDFEPTSFGQPSIRVDYTYRSPFSQYSLVAINPFKDYVKGPALERIDARFSLSEIPLGSSGVLGKLELYGENLADRHDVIATGEFGALGYGFQVYGPGRRIGIAFTADF